MQSSELNLSGQTLAQNVLIPSLSVLCDLFRINLYVVAVSLIKQFVKPNEDGSPEAEQNDRKSHSIEMVMKLDVFLLHVFVCIFGLDGGAQNTPFFEKITYQSFPLNYTQLICEPECEAKTKDCALSRSIHRLRQHCSRF